MKPFNLGEAKAGKPFEYVNGEALTFIAAAHGKVFAEYTSGGKKFARDFIEKDLGMSGPKKVKYTTYLTRINGCFHAIYTTQGTSNLDDKTVVIPGSVHEVWVEE